MKAFTSIFLFVLMMASVEAKAQAKAKPERLYPYEVYLPKAYNSEVGSTFPVMIYLHGGSHRGNNPALLKEWGPPKLIAQGRDFPFIVIMPQCPGDKVWTSDNWFIPLYRDLCRRYHVDTNFIFVTGISMGGAGTWQVAMDYPAKVRAIAPLCGTTADSVNICRIKNVDVWAFHGVNDGLIRVIHTDRLVKRLKACGGRVKYSRLEGRHHGIWNLYDTDEIYNWFLSVYLKAGES